MTFWRAFGRELTYAVRRLRQAPGFTAVAALTLGLGIGANTAVFSVIDPLLVRRLPVHEPDRLVLLHSAGTLATIDISEWSAFERYSADRDTLEAVLADAGTGNFDTTFRGRRETARGGLVSSNFFDVLGVRPELGRFFGPDDAAAGRRLVVLGYEYWKKASGADPSALGQPIVMRGTTYEIAGVAPRGFFGVTVGVVPDFYVPIDTSGPQNRWVRIVGRLRPGISLDRARLALEPAFSAIASATGIHDIERQQNMARLLVTPAGRGLSESRDALGSRPWALMMVVALTLLVACANVAGLVLTRAASRRHETALQLALGASRGRLVGRSLLEGAVVASLGAAVGLAVAHVASRALVAWLAVGPSPLALTADLNLRVLAFSAAVLTLTVLICGALPALAVMRIDVASNLKSRSTGLDRGARLSGLRRALAAAQIAASVTILSGAGLVVHSLINLQAYDVGFDADRVVAVSLRDRQTGRAVGEADQLLATIGDRVRALPGVERVGWAAVPPLSATEIGINVVPDSRPSAAPVKAFFSPSVLPGYFETLGIRLAQGGGCPNLDAKDEPVAVLNQRLAERLFGGASAIGERVRFVEGRRPPMIVVGVAADTTYTNVREEPRNFLYVCYVAGQVGSLQNRVLFVRGEAGRVDALAGAARTLVPAVDANVEVARAQTLEQYRTDSLHPDRLISRLFSGFALIAVLIAAVGLYGVLSATVVRQIPEIGLRMALGADAGGVVRFVAMPALAIAATGIALGSLGAFWSSSLLSSVLFGVSPADPLSSAAVVAVMAVVAALACLIPIRRALRVDPVVALRAE